MRKMIYNRKNYSLYYEDFIYNKNSNNFFLTIDMLELEFDLSSKKLKGISGFLPLIKAEETNNFVEAEKKEDFFLSIDTACIHQGEVFDSYDFFPEMEKYFGNLNLKYAAQQGIIQIGNLLDLKGTQIKVDKNIQIFSDSSGVIQSILIIPDIWV